MRTTATIVGARALLAAGAMFALPAAAAGHGERLGPARSS